MANESVTPTYPNVMLNGVEYQPFGQFNVTYNDTVTVHETEAGTQEDVIIRKGRRSIAVSTVCREDIASSLSLLNDQDFFEVKYYEIKSKSYATLTMRIAPGSLAVTPKVGREKHSASNGVYTVSFTLEEY